MSDHDSYSDFIISNFEGKYQQYRDQHSDSWGCRGGSKSPGAAMRKHFRSVSITRSAASERLANVTKRECNHRKRVRWI
jgi:hypothetical protein